MQVDRELDLKGEVCPFTFVKSKLIIEQMEKGQILKVILDYKPSVENVPKSMEMEGQEVLAVNQIADNLWEVLVRKVK
ncbi:sulfurtransferase TusA family protein [Sulfurihydrogenibium sp.]|uniref:sulfurtransferase TusA family protein n=1 Tax=Sulfurihydrogenibium sp. TaxID=2053621 RepID=UPI002617A8E4|nr:sulfurtransferase TusA family protein [Sulfurihydrogenibium sp.]